MVSSLNLLLATADGCELIVEQQAPELGSGLRGVGDGRDEIIFKRVAVGTVIGESEQFRSGIESCGWGDAWNGIGTVISPVAEMCSAGRRCDVPWSCYDGAFVNGCREAFDTEIDQASGIWKLALDYIG